MSVNLQESRLGTPTKVLSSRKRDRQIRLGIDFVLIVDSWFIIMLDWNETSANPAYTMNIQK